MVLIIKNMKQEIINHELVWFPFPKLFFWVLSFVFFNFNNVWNCIEWSLDIDDKIN